MKVHFITPTRISLINLTTIGDSEKREDDSKIGKFSSGQAYSTALLLRDGVNMTVSVYGGYDGQPFTEYISYGTKTKYCSTTDKKKDIIEINHEQIFHGGSPNSPHDLNEPFSPNSRKIETAFALQLGYNWELWMAYRELMSNVLDEGGYVTEDDFDEDLFIGGEESTIITLEFDENNTFYTVWQNRHLYMNFKEPLYKISDTVQVLENEEGYLRIYKQNILVYKDENVPSRFAYNIKFGTIDERRILSNIYSVECSIAEAIKYTDNEDYLRAILTPDFSAESKEFLSNLSLYGEASDLIHEIAFDVYEKCGEVKSYDWVLDLIKKRKDCKIGGKKIKSVDDSIWSYSTTVTVETSPETFSTPEVIEIEEEIFEDSFVAEIRKHYNFNLDVEVKKAKLKGSKVIADKYCKCLIIDEDFNLEEDFPEFIVQYIDLTVSGNVVKNLSEYICKLLKK